MPECKQETEFFGFSQGWRPCLVGGGEEASCEAQDDVVDAGQAGIYDIDDHAYAMDPYVELPWDDADAAAEGSGAEGPDAAVGFDAEADCGAAAGEAPEEVPQGEGEPARAAVQSGSDEAVPQEVPGRAPKLAPLIAVVGGSGGTGRSTLALLMACLAAQQDVDTVLLDGDLQFGDLGFWLGVDDDAPSLADPATCKPVSCPQGFDLYKAPVFPEVAEKVSDELAKNLNRIREGRGLVIADTGGYWSGFTASLLLQCDVFVMMTDSRPASVAAAIKASELCARLGVPSTRMVGVCNRWSSRCALSTHDIARALCVDKAYCIPDGREVVEELLRCGDFDELAQSGNPVVAATSMLLKAVLPRVGIACDLEEFRKKGLFK